MRDYAPHKYATEDMTGLQLKMHDKVVAVADLPGVPNGTQGKVILANGMNWRRYRVLFENGHELGHLDGRHIEGI
ncbi:MAG TPA: hypothetical protein VMZ22_05750 [Acidimicrobiales bacterium]|nr:hypothetical protein [Acidimicrobiales bacterium]